MSSRNSATRYAKALLDVTPDDTEAGKLEGDLTTFATLLNDHSELRQALLTPSVPASGKRGIVTSVSERIGMAPTAVRMLQLLADRDRLAMVDDLVVAFRQRLLERRKVVSAELRSAVALAPGAVAAIEAELGAVTGMNVAIDTVVDPDLIGGVLAKVGSTVFDGTVRSQLQRLRRQLLASG